jgi:hypothetical protein
MLLHCKTRCVGVATILATGKLKDWMIGLFIRINKSIMIRPVIIKLESSGHIKNPQSHRGGTEYFLFKTLCFYNFSYFSIRLY